MRRFPAWILVVVTCVLIVFPIKVSAEDNRWFFQLRGVDGGISSGQPYDVEVYFMPQNNGTAAPNDGPNSILGYFLDVMFDNLRLTYKGVTYYEHFFGGARVFVGGVVPTTPTENLISTISGIGLDANFHPDDSLDDQSQPYATEYNHLATIHFTADVTEYKASDLIAAWVEPANSYLALIDGHTFLHNPDIADDVIIQWKEDEGNLNVTFLPYVLHLGIDEDGADFFPWEHVPIDPDEGPLFYYSGVASARQALRFLSGPLVKPDDPDDPRTWPSQDVLYNDYFIGILGGTSGDDLTAQQLATLLNMLTYSHPDTGWPWRVYHFGAQADYSTVDPTLSGDPKQDLAIKRLIHWIEYDVPNVPDLPDDDYLPQINAPAHVPFGGSYTWLTIRGFSSDFPPTVDGSVHALPPELKFFGAWVNDPRVDEEDMGSNIFYSAVEFKEDYLQVEGAYRSVAEPPPSPVEEQLESSLDSIQLTYVKGKSSAAVSAALDRQQEMDVALQSQGDSVLVSGSKSLEHSQMLHSQFEEIQWEELIPVELLTAPDFAASYSDTRFNQAFTVYNIDRDEQYNLLLFGKSDSLDSASVVLQVDESNARFQTASWIEEQYQYLSSRGARRIAYEAMQESYAVNRVELTRWYKRGVVSDAQGVEQPVQYSARLVWSAELSPSEFLPVHEVSTPFGPTVLVKQDGTYTIQGELDPEFQQQEPALSMAAEEAPVDTSLTTFQETALATLPLSSLVAFESQSEEGITLYRPAEVWIRINADYSGDKNALMAQTADLFREVTGLSDRVIVTLWEGSIRVESLEF